jgi:hypothetical protein
VICPRILVSFDVGEQVAQGALPVKAMGEWTVTVFGLAMPLLFLAHVKTGRKFTA